MLLNAGSRGSRKRTILPAYTNVIARQSVYGPVDSNGFPSILPNYAVRDMLLHFDGTNGATTTTDSGNGANAPHTVTIGGTTALSTAQKNFGTASMLGVTGTTNTNGANVTAAADLFFGTGDFTWEAWIYPTANPASQSPIMQQAINNATADGLHISMTASRYIMAGNSAATYFTGSAAMALNTWHHVAYSRASGTGYLFLDGMLQWTGADATNYVTGRDLRIGRTIFASGQTDFPGYIDEVATLKGTAVYTAPFQVPVQPYTISSGLSITTQNITSSAPLIMSAAQGFNSLGDADTTISVTTNQTLTSLSANQTLYLYCNTATGQFSTTTTAPIYQTGGTISTTSGQWTFDTTKMAGYLGNGTTAPLSPLVFIGELTTNSANVSGAIAYAYAGGYTSPLRAWPGAQTTMVSHNMGVPPAFIDGRWRAVNVSTELGYAQGAEIDPLGITLSNASSTAGFTPASISRTQAALVAAASFVGATAAVNTGTLTTMTPSKWNLRYYARRRF